MNILGKGLNLTIEAELAPIYEWMTFALWYSIQKYLPDSEITICFNGKINYNMFEWVKKVKLTISDTGIKIKPYFIMIREISENDLALFSGKYLNKKLICLAKGEKFKPFAYCNEVGNFIMNEWINNTEFPDSDKFLTHNATFNEVKVLKLWRQAKFLYTSIRS